MFGEQTGPRDAIPKKKTNFAPSSTELGKSLAIQIPSGNMSCGVSRIPNWWLSYLRMIDPVGELNTCL
jgi:hypothetical protein